MEDTMLEQYHEARFAPSIALVFAALLRSLAQGRWANMAVYGETAVLPRTGFQYSSRYNGRLRRGEVIECLRPVSIVILETLQRSPSFVRVRQRWRVQPLARDTRLSCDLKAELNRIAHLHRRNWETRFEREITKLLAAVRDEFAQAHGVASGSVGQRIGNASIVKTNSRIVNGKPILR